MRLAAALLVLLAGAATALADCPLDRIAAALDAPLDAMTPLEREVSDVRSTEGGVWQIYRETDGRLDTIVRIDAGESGRSETRLSVVSRNIYGIARTRIDYLRHAFVEEGPFGIARRTTDYYYYCDGAAHVPAPEAATVDVAQYPKDAAAQRALMLDDADVAPFTKGLAR